jgi:ABC-type nitrate/sulfonate/bicarbonate transport system permease component
MRREVYCGHLMGNAHEAAPSREGGQRRTADVLAGLRLSLTVSPILTVVCEMIDGLGQWVLLAARSYKSADLFAGVMLLGAIGLVANSALSLAEGRLLRWRAREE